MLKLTIVGVDFIQISFRLALTELEKKEDARSDFSYPTNDRS